MAENLPGFQQTLDDNEDRRPLIVLSVRRWQPLLQLLVDSGVATMVEERTHVGFPVLEIQNVAAVYEPGHGLDRKPIASVWPRKEEIDVSRVSSYEIGSDPLSAGWTVRVVLDYENPTLHVKASHIPDFGKIEPYVYEGHEHSVSLRVDPERNLTVSGATETFNGSIDHLSKRGKQRLTAAIDRAFKTPLVSEKPYFVGIL